MQVTECVNKRCLIRFKKDSWNKDYVVEVSIIELSPSKEWVKLYYEESANYVWWSTKEIILIEELGPTLEFKEIGIEDL